MIKFLPRVALLIVVLALVALSARLMFFTSPSSFLHLEIQGIAFDNLNLSDVCSPNIRAGLEGNTSNVSDDRGQSLLFVAPTKLLKRFVSPLLVHRVVLWCSYLLFLAGVALCCWILRTPMLVSSALILFLGLHAEFIAPMLEGKLAVTALAWLTIALAFIMSTFDSALRGERRALMLAFLTPPIISSGYECYAIARPLGIVLWVCGLVSCFFIALRRYSLFYAFGTIVSMGCIYVVHPNITFDFGFIHARGESIFTGGRALKSEAPAAMLERANELAKIFSFAPLGQIETESKDQIGWLEMLLPLLAVVTVLGLRATGGGAATDVRASAKTLWPHLAVLLVIALAGLLIPVFSTTYVRGHRLFGFYVGTALLFSALTGILWRCSGAFLHYTLALTVWAFVVFFASHRVPVLLAWAPPDDRPGFFQLVEDLRKLSHHSTQLEGTLQLNICDRKNPPDWRPAWQAALYLSDFGCELGVQRIEMFCRPGPMSLYDSSVKVTWLERTFIDGTNHLYINH